MSKYDPLGEHLDRRGASTMVVTMTFKQVEKALMFRLPESAHKHYASWWANDKTHVQAKSWLSWGWRKHSVHVDKKQVIFWRDDSTAPAKSRQPKRALAANSWLNNKTGKYSKLGDHLDKQTTSPIKMTFKQIEKVLGFPMAPSAYKHHYWWSNGGGQANTWVSRGWRTEKVSMPGQRVTFQRYR